MAGQYGRTAPRVRRLTMAVQFYNDQVLFVDGKVAMHADCCCGQDCPTDCSTCDDPITATVSGLSGSCSGTDCSNLEGTNDLSLQSGTCTWSKAQWNNNMDYSASIICGTQEWTFALKITGGDCAIWTAPNTDGCPPTSGWTFDSTNSSCSGGSLSLA